MNHEGELVIHTCKCGDHDAAGRGTGGRDGRDRDDDVPEGPPEGDWPTDDAELWGLTEELVEASALRDDAELVGRGPLPPPPPDVSELVPPPPPATLLLLELLELLTVSSSP